MKKKLFGIKYDDIHYNNDNKEIILIERYANSDIAHKSYLMNNRPHREDGPASIYYRKDGSIEAEYYSINGYYHRENGPAAVIYRSNGNIDCESYYKKGNLHREDGPAKIYYDKDGNIKSKAFYIDDKQYNEFEYYVLAASLK